MVFIDHELIIVKRAIQLCYAAGMDSKEFDSCNDRFIIMQASNGSEHDDILDEIVDVFGPSVCICWQILDLALRLTAYQTKDYPELLQLYRRVEIGID